MRSQLRWLLAPVAVLVLSAPTLADGNANFVVGLRGLDEGFWEPTENQGVFGVTVDFGNERWPVHLELGAFGSSNEEEIDFFGTDVTLTGAVGEFTFGVNKPWQPGENVRTFVGGGLAAVSASAEVDTPFGDEDDDDDSFGLYAHGGAFWRLGPRFNIGVDGRLLAGTDVTLFDDEGDADYFQVGLILGWGWPAAQ